MLFDIRTKDLTAVIATRVTKNIFVDDECSFFTQQHMRVRY